MKALCLVATVLFLQSVGESSSAHAAEASVTVHLLDHTGEKKTKQRFWIDWSKAWRAITATKTVTGADADALVKLLRKSLLETESMNFCGHDPIYGIEATTSDGKQLKTSLCFKCLTWVQPGRRLDIAGKLGIENDLCVALRKVIELPKDVIDRQTPPK